MPEETTKQSAINLRINSDAKQDAQEIFNELGLTMSSAITIFLKACVREGGIPFDVTLNNDQSNQ